MGPTLGPSGADRTQVGPMLAPWTLLSILNLAQREVKNYQYECDLSCLAGLLINMSLTQPLCQAQGPPNTGADSWNKKVIFISRSSSLNRGNSNGYLSKQVKCDIIFRLYLSSSFFPTMFPFITSYIPIFALRDILELLGLHILKWNLVSRFWQCYISLTNSFDLLTIFYATAK